MVAAASLRRIYSRASQTQVGIGLVATTTLLALLAFTFALQLGFKASLNLVDGLDRSSQEQLAANYISRSGRELIDQQRVQLSWDEAVLNAGTKVNPAWADEYIGAFLSSNFHFDRLYLVSPKGELLRSWDRGKLASGADFAAIAGSVQQQLQVLSGNQSIQGKPARMVRLRDTMWPVDENGRPLTRASVQTISFNGHPALVSVISIIPDTDYSLLRQTQNHVVAVRSLDDKYLASLGKGLLFDNVRFQSAKPADEAANALQLRDSAGKPLGWVSWAVEPASKIIKDRMVPLAMAYFLFLVAVIGGGAAIVRSLVQVMRDLRQRESQAHHLAMHDAMTGLPNRTHFLQQLDRALAGPLQDNEVVIVAFLDLDHFKYINDNLGHSFGDELIAQVAERCGFGLDADDLVSRFGGDEFVVMRKVSRSKSGPSRLAEEIMALFKEPFIVGGRPIDVSSSCGVSWAPDQGSTAAELLRNADIALYQAKQRGRNRWRGFTPDMGEKMRQRHELAVELRRAIAEDELSVAYQPIVNARTGQIECLEALLRWEHPDQGLISPGLFVPVAEQSGLMNPLGWWALRRVFHESRRWPQQCISINLSPLQLMSHGFLGQLGELVVEMKVDTSRVTFEVTESVLMENSRRVYEVLEGLRDMGFAIALDDFGTGYSSLSYLRMFRFDRIKIDRSFVQNIENDLDAQSILKAIAGMGSALRMKLVAEGVETPLQRQLVIAAGCQMIQGHLFWKAMPADAITPLLERPARKLRGRAA